MPTTIISGALDYRLPNWGRCFWQDPNDGELFLAFTSGLREVDYVTSNDGIIWSEPKFLFPIDDFSVHSNFDILMDREGNIHCGFRYRNLNCYKFMGKKPGGGWTAASGNGVVPYQLAGDSGNVKGYQGSLCAVYEDSLGFGLVPTPVPCVFIASKASGLPGERDNVEVFYINTPFNSTPTYHGFVTKCGTNGGYPLVGNGDVNAPTVFLLNDRTNSFGQGRVEQYTYFFAYNLEDAYGEYSTSNFNMFGETMGIGSGVGSDNGIFVVIGSPSGQDFYSTIEGNSNLERIIAHGSESADGNGFTWQDQFPTGLYGVLPNGTNCDFTHGNNPGEQIVYFQTYNGDGRHCIGRIKGFYKDGDKKYSWPPFNSASGINYVVETDRFHTGGVNGRSYWRRFKALKHPTSPGDGVSKKELIVTLSQPPTLDSGCMITVHDVGNSQALTSQFPIPNYLMDFTRSSSFSGVVASGGFTGHVPYLFDGNSSTSATLGAGGGYLELAFNENIHLTKIQFWKDFIFAGWGTMSISGSLDGENWYRFFSSSDSAITYFDSWVTSNRNYGDPDTAPQANRILGEYIDSSIVAKRLRFHWTGNASVPINEIMVWGPSSMTFNRTWADYLEIGIEQKTMYTRPHTGSETRIEEFVYPQDEIPAGWSTGGDFGWSVDASGDFRRTSDLPSAYLSNAGDTVSSGTWAGRTHGLMDSFALVARPTSQAGHSGYIQTDVNLFRDYNGPRTISFYYRTDLHPNDVFVFATGNSLGFHPKLTVGPSSSPSNYTQFSVNLPWYDTYTLRWSLLRGSGVGNSNLGTVWIDRVAGLDSPPQPSIGGFLVGSMFPASGVIHGYLSAKGFSTIHGYTHATGQISSINGYTKSQTFPDAISSINGYALGATYGSVHGFTLGASGILKSIPTGSIHGIIPGASGVGMSSIYGYVRPMPQSAIYGYANTYDFASGSIHGLVNGSGDNVVSSIVNGFVQGHRRTQVIYGVVPDVYGAETGSINGYVLAYNSSSIHGYVGNSGVVSSTHGYTKGYEGFQFIHGYVKRPSGTISTIHGYVPSAYNDNDSIHGYVLAGDSFSSIHGYASGVGEALSSTHGYVVGISGSINSNVHGYVVGEGLATSTIYGILIGMYASGVEVCSSHLFPLPAIDSGVMPSGWECNMLM